MRGFKIMGKFSRAAFSGSGLSNSPFAQIDDPQSMPVNNSAFRLPIDYGSTSVFQPLDGYPEPLLVLPTGLASPHDVIRLLC